MLRRTQTRKIKTKTVFLNTTLPSESFLIIIHCCLFIYINLTSDAIFNLELCDRDGQLYRLVTPVGGQLLELNHNLTDNPTLLDDDDFEYSGYIAIILPNTEIPSPKECGGCETYDELEERLTAKRARRNICFAWEKGECSRGGTCRFHHALL
jgi:hypothetical protein